MTPTNKTCIYCHNPECYGQCLMNAYPQTINKPLEGLTPEYQRGFDDGYSVKLYNIPCFKCGHLNNSEMSDEIKRLREALGIAVFYVKAYIHIEAGHGEDIRPLKAHLKQIEQALSTKGE